MTNVSQIKYKNILSYKFHLFYFSINYTINNILHNIFIGFNRYGGLLYAMGICKFGNIVHFIHLCIDKYRYLNTFIFSVMYY